jgi:hypothetical protein
MINAIAHAVFHLAPDEPITKEQADAIKDRIDRAVQAAFEALERDWELRLELASGRRTSGAIVVRPEQMKPAVLAALREIIGAP